MGRKLLWGGGLACPEKMRLHNQCRDMNPYTSRDSICKYLLIAFLRHFNPVTQLQVRNKGQGLRSMKQIWLALLIEMVIIART